MDETNDEKVAKDVVEKWREDWRLAAGVEREVGLSGSVYQSLRTYIAAALRAKGRPILWPVKWRRVRDGPIPGGPGAVVIVDGVEYALTRADVIDMVRAQYPADDKKQKDAPSISERIDRMAVVLGRLAETVEKQGVALSELGRRGWFR